MGNFAPKGDYIDI